MIVHFITVLDGIITGQHCGILEADFSGTPYHGHKKIIVPAGVTVKEQDKLEFYDKNWKRKSDIQLLDEGQIVLPAGYVREGNEIREMTQEERVIAGIDEPPNGYKVENNEIVEMTLQEKITAGVITQEEYNRQSEAENIVELERRLAELNTERAKAKAEVDEIYAQERRVKIIELLAVENQKDWPLEVDWP